MKIKPLYLLLFFIGVTVQSQIPELSSQATVSVITIGPGESLNDAFGHNAFRITDKNLGIDLVYGYGEYDFEAPYFYLKFAQGKLNYLMSRHHFKDIYRYYSTSNRSIKEQILNYNQKEKQVLFSFLEDNYKPENRRYLYDFFYDNCATRIRDVTELSSTEKIEYNIPKGFSSKTFRSLIYEHVNKNSWGSLGIDLALGSVIDREATPREYMFLPKYIYQFFEEATISSNKLLVQSSTVLFNNKENRNNWPFYYSPLFILGILSILLLFSTYKENKVNKRKRWIDVLLGGVTGLVGIVLALLWFATDHTSTAYNYNLLWAFPLNILLIVQLSRKQPSKWVKGFIKFLLLMLCLLTLHWLIGVQVFAISLIPFFIALFFRYIYVLKTLK